MHHHDHRFCSYTTTISSQVSLRVGAILHHHEGIASLFFLSNCIRRPCGVPPTLSQSVDLAAQQVCRCSQVVRWRTFVCAMLTQLARQDWPAGASVCTVCAGAECFAQEFYVYLFRRLFRVAASGCVPLTRTGSSANRLTHSRSLDTAPCPLLPNFTVSRLLAASINHETGHPRLLDTVCFFLIPSFFLLPRCCFLPHPSQSPPEPQSPGTSVRTILVHWQGTITATKKKRGWGCLSESHRPVPLS